MIEGQFALKYYRECFYGKIFVRIGDEMIW